MDHLDLVPRKYSTSKNQLRIKTNPTEKRKPMPRITDKIVNTGFQSSLKKKDQTIISENHSMN